MDETCAVISEQANLEYYPMDVLMEILTYLDCRDVVRLRQVGNWTFRFPTLSYNLDRPQGA